MRTRPATPLPTEGTPPPAARPVSRTSPRRLLADRSARWLVTAGGMGIIASILGILLFILIEVFPLLRPAQVSGGRTLSAGPGALATDDYRTHVAVLGEDGVYRAYRTADGSLALEQPLATGSDAPLDRLTAAPDGMLLGGVTPDGDILATEVAWSIGYREQERVVTPEEPEPVRLEIGERPRVYSLRGDDEGGVIVAAQIADGSIVVIRRTVEEQPFTGEREESFERSRIPFDEPLACLALDRNGKNLFGGTPGGDVVWWRLEDPAVPDVASAGPSAITAMALLLGDRSLVVGQADGTVSVWFPVRQKEGNFRIEHIRDLARYPAAVRALAPSRRNKGVLVADESGRVGLHHSTSERTLWVGDSPVGPPQAMVFSPRADGAFLAGEGRIAELKIDNPHPEISLRALFGKVWYEGYGDPEYVWQSSGGTDDFEPKLSLVPLLAGTLKGTFYSLFLAIPLGVLGAMYTSQFLHPRLKQVVKPVVEIMAALPSVVLGFLAGLWLAPRVGNALPALMMMILLLPLMILAAGAGWRRLPRRIRGRFPDGAEAFGYVLVLAAGIALCLALNDPVESLVFGGDTQAWLLQVTGLPYDQRNAVIVGLGMGFAVIPIIFAISEDAFSNVPRSLVSGSLALGASRWQTVTQVVLPSASPGIFSAVMVGFGRAIGETMIVLMATGNTPILDWNPFNGFRTLSANIAVEIPEAPMGGTLYRTLFLAALLLFALTFVVNTAAEVIRQRLRRRYAEL